MSELRKHIAGQVHLEFYREGYLFYRTDTGLGFAVPINDVGQAAMLRDDRAILFMRWIRKHLEMQKAECA